MLQLNNETLLRSSALINGEWVNPKPDQCFTVFNPATGEEVSRLPDLTAADAKTAILAAYEALPDWSRLTAKQRAKKLNKWYQLILDNQDDLARIMTAEQGKPLSEAAGEIAYGASFIEWFAEEGKRAYGDIIPTHRQGKRVLVTKEPIGVVAAITPWNFPNAMIARKCAPALSAGCTFVIKPPAATPLSALALAELALQAGIPRRVINVVTTTDSEDVGKELTENSLVRKFTFTGSTVVGKQLMRQCASTVKNITLELGGNAPFIVFDDANIASAVEGLMASKYRNMGQTCICANRIFVHENIYQDFLTQLIDKVKSLTVGDGFDEEAQQGPLINSDAIAKVARLIDDAQAKGAQVILGGKPHPNGENFFEPTILSQVTMDMDIAKEEIFGPVAPLLLFNDETDVITMANKTNAGLAAYFYTQDTARIFRVADQLQYGMVGINEGHVSTEVAPFGGMKESGIGREGSKYGIEDYLETKYLLLGGLEQH